MANYDAMFTLEKKFHYQKILLTSFKIKIFLNIIYFIRKREAQKNRISITYSKFHRNVIKRDNIFLC